VPVEAILQLLENGRWHHLSDIQKKTMLHRSKIEALTRFLANYNFIKIDDEKQKVKIDPSLKQFLARLRQLEK